MVNGNHLPISPVLVSSNKTINDISVRLHSDRVRYLTAKPPKDRTQIKHTHTLTLSQTHAHTKTHTEWEQSKRVREASWTGDKLTTSHRAIHQGAEDSKRQVINIAFFKRAHTISCIFHTVPWAHMQTCIPDALHQSWAFKLCLSPVWSRWFPYSPDVGHLCG